MKVFAVMALMSVSTMHAENWACHWPDDERGRLTIGMKLGATKSAIDKVPEMMANEDRRPDYAWTDKPYIMPTMCLFAEYMQGGIGAELDLGYYSQGSKQTRLYNNGLQEDYKFAYPFAYASLYVKVYCYQGFYMCGGFRYGINLKTDAIDYSSSKYGNYSAYGSQRQEHLRESLVGKNDYGPSLQLGYEFPFGLLAELRYHFGVADMIATNPNKYGFSEQNNTTNMLELTLGYAITIFDHETGRKRWKAYKSRPYWVH